MGNKFNHRFNFKKLLTREDLDIRKVARNSLSLRVGDYFNLLAKFLRHVHYALDALEKAIKNKASDSDWKSLDSIVSMLENIGCDKFSLAIGETISAGKRGHGQFAAERAKTVLDEFIELKLFLEKAKASDSPKDDPNEDELFPENYEQQTIREMLQLLDQKKITRKMRILAIDDSPVMLQTISSALESNYKVYCLTDPTKIQDFLYQITPDLFLIDYKMPELSGFDLIPIIRSFKEHLNTPIIFLTAMGTPGHVSAALSLGACDFIVKPVQDDVLREKIAKHIVRKNLF